MGVVADGQARGLILALDLAPLAAAPWDAALLGVAAGLWTTAFASFLARCWSTLTAAPSRLRQP